MTKTRKANTEAFRARLQAAVAKAPGSEPITSGQTTDSDRFDGAGSGRLSIPTKTLNLELSDASNKIDAEVQALSSFLNQHWDVEFRPVGEDEPLTGAEHDAALDQLLSSALEAGIQQGKSFVAQQLDMSIETANMMASLTPGEGATKYVMDPSIGPAADFSLVTGGVRKRAEKAFDISAAPKGYAEFRKTADEYGEDGPEADDFKGSAPHFMLNAVDSGSQLSRQGVFYNEERSRDPLTTLISAAVTQGMNIPASELYVPLHKMLLEAAQPRS